VLLMAGGGVIVCALAPVGIVFAVRHRKSLAAAQAQRTNR